MSKNSQGYMGSQIGKLGPAVGFRWKGKNVYRSHQPFVRNPKTMKQQLNRAIFKAIQELSMRFGGAVNIGFRRESDEKQTTTRGLFTLYNRPAVQADSPDSVTIDFASMVVARGPMTNVSFGSPDFETPNEVNITFDDMESAGLATFDDEVYLFVYCPDAKCGVLSTPVTRDDHSASVTVPAAWNGSKVHIWGFVRSSYTEPTWIDQYGGYMYPNMVSDSVYCGSGNIG